MTKKITYDNWNLLYSHINPHISKNFKSSDQEKNKIFFLNNIPTLIFSDEYQDIIYDSLANDVILLTGATGLGKSRFFPHLVYNYFKNFKDQPLPKIIITEPRRTTVLMPYETMARDVGQMPAEDKFVNLFTHYDLKKINRDEYNTFFRDAIMKIDLEKKKKTVIEYFPSGSILAFYISKDITKVISYQISEDATFDNNDSFIRFQTDGFFFNFINSLSYLETLDAIIIDEIHEASISTILTLIFLSIYKKEKSITAKIILISASLTERDKFFYKNLFPNFFTLDLPSVTLKPILKIKVKEHNILDIIIRNTHKNGLVFLQSSFEIANYKKNIYDKINSNKKYIIIEFSKQFDEYFFSETMNILKTLNNLGYKYLILATNIAESSLTYPDLDFVIDSGLKKNIIFTISTRITNVKTEKITLNSQIQRQGRVGRTIAGEYYYIFDNKELTQYENKLLKNNISLDIINLIISKRYNIFKNILNTCFKEIDIDFFYNYEKELIKLNLIKFSLNSDETFDITSVYTNINNLKSIFYKDENGIKKFPIRKANVSLLTLLYHHPKIEILLLILLIEKKLLSEFIKVNQLSYFNDNIKQVDLIKIIDYIILNKIILVKMFKNKYNLNIYFFIEMINNYELADKDNLKLSLLYSLNLYRTKSLTNNIEYLYLPLTNNIDQSIIFNDIRINKF
jgi:hypothetical protein